MKMPFAEQINRARAYLAAHPRWRFLLLAAGLYVAWEVGYEQLVGPDGRLDDALSANIAWAAALLLRGAGFAAGLAPQAKFPTVTMGGQPAVFVGAPCNGLVLYALFAGFVLAYPGRGGHKGAFISLGIGALYALNVGRVALLALNHTYWYHTVDFNHHYTFSFVAYAAIFGLWRYWAQRRAPDSPAHEPAH